MTIRQLDIQSFIEVAGNFKCGNASYLITGGTGLIGYTLVECLLSLNNNIDITIPVRNMRKALTLFARYDKNHLHIIECDLLHYLKSIPSNIKYDYIIHCASPTNGYFMIDNPVETYLFSLETTKAILDYTRRCSVESLVYLSSVEYYGQVYKEQKIKEDFIGYIDYSDPRSSYPLGKRASEFLCKMYAMKYNIPVKIARLTQTFGAGIMKSDNRVYAQFARSIVNGNNIILHTNGDSSKPYCYTIDCITAILSILLYGHNGFSYNVANEETYISIRDLAFFLKHKFNDSIEVQIDLQEINSYAPTTHLRLDCELLRELGWIPQYGLEEMFRRLIISLQE